MKECPHNCERTIILNGIRYLHCWQYHAFGWNKTYGVIEPDCDLITIVPGQGYSELVICPDCQPEYARSKIKSTEQIRV